MEQQCDIGLRLFDQNNATADVLLQFQNFRLAYQPYHGYICLNICVLGVLTNVINIVVLTKPRMRSSINVILTAIAVCDMGTMLSYLIYLLHFVVLFEVCSPSGYSYHWMRWLMVHILGSVVLHTSSLWLSVLLAFVRTWTLRKNRTVSSTWLRTEGTWKLCAAVYAVVLALSLPNLFAQNVVDATAAFNDTCPGDVAAGTRYYTVGIPNCSLYRMNLWINGVVFKTVPCILLAYFSFALLCIIRDANLRKKRLFSPLVRPQISSHVTSTNNNPASCTSEVPLVPRGRFLGIHRLFSQSMGSVTTALSSSGTFNQRHTFGFHANKKKIRRDRTTPMLLVILFIFLFTELPQGVIAVLSGLYIRDVRLVIYDNLGDVLDLLSLVNSSVNFFLYCTMSAKYRQTFWQSILPTSIYQRIRPLSIAQRHRSTAGGATTAGAGDSHDELEGTAMPDTKASLHASMHQSSGDSNGRN